jgi:hypothetical protein
MTYEEWLLTLGFKDPDALTKAQSYNLELCFETREPETFEEFLGCYGFEDGAGLNDVQRANLRIIAQETYGIGDAAAADEDGDDLEDLDEEDLGDEPVPNG